MREGQPAFLLGLTGLRIDGGIASVSRSVARVLDAEVASGTLSRVDRVLLLEDPEQPAAPPARGEQWLARGSQARFAWQLWRAYRRSRPDRLFFDLVGLARALEVPLPGYPPRDVTIFVHGIELGTAQRGSRARALRRARRVLVNSEFTAQCVRRALPELAERIRVVPLCVDPEREAAWRAPDPHATREQAALIVGRMWSEEPGKGHEALLAAWPSVRAHLPRAELWIVGGGDDRVRHEQRARELGVAGAVRFFGRVSDEVLGDLYRRASLFAMPSRQEGFGLVYAEAMWHGLPCLGSTADAAGDVIAPEETGLLVPFGDVEATSDAVVRVLGDPAQVARMGAAGRCRALTAFSFSRFRRDLLAALDLA